MPFLRHFAALILALALCWVWRHAAPLGCLSLVLALTVATLVVAGPREHALRRRHCLASCYFRPGSTPFRWLHGRTLATLRGLPIALLATTVLLLGLLVWERKLLALLVFDTLLLAALFALFGGLSKRTFEPRSAAVLVKHWTVGVNTTLMAAAFMAVQLYSPVPHYLEPTLAATVESASRQVASECPAIDLALEAYMEKEAFAWWLMLRGVEHFDAPSLRWAAWAIFLLSGTLGLWAYSRFVVQLLGFAHGGDRGSDAEIVS